MRRADRLFQTVQHLRARRLTTAAQLAEWLGVSPRTVYRDIRDLTLSGVPVQGEAGVGYRIDRSYELTPLMFTPDEVEAVVLGLRMAQTFAAPSLQTAARSAMEKVGLALPEHRQEEVHQSQLYAFNFRRDPLAMERMEQVRQAIATRHKLNLVYQDKKQAETRRTVRPIALYFLGTGWLLAAWCETRKDFRNFWLHTMTSCEISADTFPLEPDKTLAEFLKSVGAT